MYRRSHIHAVNTDNGDARTHATLKLATGPKSSVTGAKSTPSAITGVFHIALDSHWRVDVTSCGRMPAARQRGTVSISTTKRKCRVEHTAAKAHASRGAAASGARATN